MLPRRHPSDIQDARLVAVLVKYVPPIIARSIVERARREAVSGPEVSWTDPNGLLDRISVGVRLFAAPEHQSAILREITDMAVADAEPLSAGREPLDDAGPASTLKPNAPRIRVEDTASTRRDPAGPPPSGGPASAGERPPPSGAGASPPPSGPFAPPGSLAGPPSSGSGAIGGGLTPPPGAPAPSGGAPSLGGPPSRRDTDVMGVFAAPTRRTPHDAPPSSRGVFPTTPRAGSPAMGRLTGARPTTPLPAAPTTPVPPASPIPAIYPPGAIRKTTPAAGTRQPPQPPERVESREITITLTTEHDIPRARQVAREICEALGTRALTQQRLVTIVSELGRNMVLYAGGGKITLRPPLSSTRRVVVLAVDQGPGIANLQDIMAGRYKSRSGLGLGIVGTKRLADSFHIETGRNGTAISVEVIV